MKTGFTSEERRAILGLSGVLGARMLGFSLVLPVFSLYAVDKLHATPLQAGIAFGAYGLSQALLQIPFGSMSDRYGRRTVVSGGLAIFIAGAIIAAMTSSVGWLILGMFLQGSGAIASSLFAWVADTTRPEKRNFAMAMLGISIGAAIILGLSVSAPMAAWLGVRGIFWICAALSALAVLIVARMPEPRAVEHAAEAPAAAAEAVPTFELATLSLSGFIMNFTMRAVFFAVPLALLHTYGMAEAAMWKIYLPLGFIGGMCMMAGSRLSDRGRARSMIAGSFLLTAIGYVLLGFVVSFAATVAGYCAYFAGFSVLEALLPAAVSKLASTATRGRTLGVYNTCQYLGTAFGGGVAGKMVNPNQIPHGLYVVLLALSLTAMALASRLRRVDRVRGPEMAMSA